MVWLRIGLQGRMGLGSLVMRSCMVYRDVCGGGVRSHLVVKIHARSLALVMAQLSLHFLCHTGRLLRWYIPDRLLNARLSIVDKRS